MSLTTSFQPASLLLGLLLTSGVVVADTFERVSVSTGGEQANGASSSPLVSADGKIVVFVSSASNLVDGDTNGVDDIFVRDRTTGKTERVSVDSAGGQANDSSSSPSISADGRYVAFVTQASNLVADDTNDIDDVFLHDRQTGATTRVSLMPNNSQIDFSSFGIGIPRSVGGLISANGRFVLFSVGGVEIRFRNYVSSIYVRDLLLGTTGELAGVGGTPNLDGISSDGQRALLHTDSRLSGVDTNLSPDAYLIDRGKNTTEIISRTFDGQEAWPGPKIYEGPGYAYFPSGHYLKHSFLGVSTVIMSADQSVVAFDSVASNMVPYDYNEGRDVFVRDLARNTLERVSLSTTGKEADWDASLSGLSGDGQFVAFSSFAGNLVSNDENQALDVFIHDRKTHYTWRVSQIGEGIEGNGQSYDGALSHNGRVIAFTSAATNFVDGDSNGVADIFVKEIPALPNSADLSVTWDTLDLNYYPAHPAQVATLPFVVTAKNNSARAASHVKVVIELSAGYVPKKLTTGCVSDKVKLSGLYRVTCQMGRLAGGASVSERFNITQNRHGSFHAKAVVQADQFDPNLSNNTYDRGWLYENLLMLSGPGTGDVGLEVKANAKSVKVGGKVQFKSIIKNNGNVKAEDVLLTQRFYDPVKLASIPKTCSLSFPFESRYPRLACKIGTLKPHGQVSLILAVNPKTAGNLEVYGNVSSTLADTDFSNDSLTAVVTVEE